MIVLRNIKIKSTAKDSEFITRNKEKQKDSVVLSVRKRKALNLTKGRDLFFVRVGYTWG